MYRLYINGVDNSGKKRVTTEVSNYESIKQAIETFQVIVEKYKFVIVCPEKNPGTQLAINVNTITHGSVIEVDQSYDDSLEE